MFAVKGKTFPMAERIITAMNLSIRHLVITSLSDVIAAGYYDHSDNTICLNINVKVLEKVFNRYNVLASNRTEKLIRTACAVIYEECYHAIHHGLESNIHALAIPFAIEHTNKIPTDELYKFGGNLKQEINMPETHDLLTFERDHKIALESGTMVNWINKVGKKADMTNIEIETPYGSITLNNGKLKTSALIKPDINKLESIRSNLGTAERIGIEHGGIIYVYDENKWTTMVDVKSEVVAGFDFTAELLVELNKEEGANLVHATEKP